MESLVWIGAFVSVLGLLGLIKSILQVNRARHQNLTDEELRAVVKAAMPINLGSLFLSVIGLMIVMLGLAFS